MSYTDRIGRAGNGDAAVPDLPAQDAPGRCFAVGCRNLWDLADKGVLLRSRAEDLVNMADKFSREFITLDDITAGDMCLGMAESFQIGLPARVIC